MARWFLFFGSVAVLALIAGFVTFSGGDMGPNDSADGQLYGLLTISYSSCSLLYSRLVGGR